MAETGQDHPSLMSPRFQASSPPGPGLCSIEHRSSPTGSSEGSEGDPTGSALSFQPAPCRISASDVHRQLRQRYTNSVAVRRIFPYENGVT
jgi:hypothetical protein